MTIYLHPSAGFFIRRISALKLPRLIKGKDHGAKYL
jgi:hypothetical protein